MQTVLASRHALSASLVCLILHRASQCSRLSLGSSAKLLQDCPQYSISHPDAAPTQDVLAVGEHVRCVVLGMEDDFSRISLSTAELEEHDGDMKRDKVRPRMPRLCTAIAAWRRVTACRLADQQSHSPLLFA